MNKFSLTELLNTKDWLYSIGDNWNQFDIEHFLYDIVCSMSLKVYFGMSLPIQSTYVIK